ncbi:MAG: hypothetical protein ACRCS8_03300 [Brevinema sp.]
MKEITIITYRHSVLEAIMPFFDLQNNITILDEKADLDLCLERMVDEIWIDAYIDLYDPRLEDPQYLHHFFIRLQNILNKTQKAKFKPLVRIMRNFYYDTSHVELKKVFGLYRYSIEFLKYAYEVFEIMVPDILHESYKFHPYHDMKKSSLIWNIHSTFQIIHQNDIVYNILEHTLDKEGVMISGIRVAMADICQKSEQIFGEKPSSFEEAYLITVQDLPQILSLDENHYNLETIFMGQLS